LPGLNNGKLPVAPEREPGARHMRLINMWIRQCDRDPRATHAALTDRVAQYLAGVADARTAQKGGGSSP